MGEFANIFASLIVIIILGLFLVPMLIVYIVGLWHLFKKAGHDGWEAIIPFYSTFVLAEIAGIAWWYPLIIILSSLGIFDDGQLGTILSIAAFVASFFMYYNLSKKFHKDTKIAVLLTIFPIIMIPVFGLSKNYKYDRDVIVSENGPVGGGDTYQEDTFNDGDGNDKYYCQHCGKMVNEDAKYCGNCGNEIKR